MLAALNGNTDTAKALLEAGADLEAKNNNGGTALMLAALNGNTDTAKALLEAGADLEAKNNNGGTALMSAAQQGHTEIQAIPSVPIKRPQKRKSGRTLFRTRKTLHSRPSPPPHHSTWTGSIAKLSENRSGLPKSPSFPNR